MSAQGESVNLPEELSFERPKGEQLGEFIESFVVSLPPGSMLPSERATAERYGVARMTVRQELDRLVAKGLIYRVQGRGTFVAGAKLEQSGKVLTSFSEDMGARGMTPGARVMSQKVQPATEIVARALGIEPQMPVVRIDRVRTADGEPMAYEHAYLPAKRFGGLDREDLEDASLYGLLHKHWGVVLGHAVQTATAVALSDEEAGLLQVPPGQPAFLFQRVTHDDDGAVIEYVRSLYRGDRYEVRTYLERNRSV